MPVVDIEGSPIFAPVDTPKRFAVTPGEADINHGSDKPDGSILAAAFRQDNTVGAYLARETDIDNREIEEGFNAWEKIKDTKYERRWESFVNVRNSRALSAMQRQIDREDEDRKLLDSAPWYQSLPAQMAAGVIDLPTLIPGGAFIRGARGGFSIVRSAVATGTAAGAAATAQEVALQELTETRTAFESGINIGASVFLGGLLGGGGAKLLSRAEWNQAVTKLEQDLSNLEQDLSSSVRGSVGAAAVEPLDIEANAIAGRAASAVAASTAKLNPALRLLQSPSAASRDTSTKLFENSLYLKKNFDGVASEPAVETLMKEHNAGLVRALSATQTAYSEYAKAGGPMNYLEFRQAVGRAMRRGDDDPDKFVASAAKSWRAQVFDPPKDMAINLKMLPEDVSVDTAASYFSRMWNRNKLIAREGKFKQIVMKWVADNSPRWAESFDRKTLEEAVKLEGPAKAKYLAQREALRDERFGDAAAIRQAGRDVADNVFNTLTGKGDSVVRPEHARVGVRGPLKERTFSIPDELIEEFLEDDVEIVGRRYVRLMGADIELTNKFGSVDLQDQIAKVREDYAKLRDAATSEKERLHLEASEKRDISDIESLRDVLRGNSIYNHSVEQNYGRIVRVANHFNYIRSMGEVVLASLTDAVRPAMVHGLGQFMQTIPQLAGNMKAVKLLVGEAQLAGNVAERVLQSRFATISEIVDPYASRGPVEAFMQNMTDFASKWNGIRVWTDMMKSVTSVMTQNRILQNAENFAKVRDKEKAYLAFLGIDESMAERIAKQFAEHGENIDGVRVANTESWTDQVAVRTYRAALNKDVDSIVVTRSVADVPLFAHTPTGKALLQFKTFALASHQRILLRGLQEDSTRFVGGVVAMTAMGMFVTYMKAVSGNRPEIQEKALNNPGWWIGEGLDRSGVFSVPMELANIFEKATGLNPIKSPIKVWDETGGISQKMQNRNAVGSLLGPSIGMGEDVMTAAGIPKRVIEGEEISKGQKSAVERLIPFNSYAGVRQTIRHLVGE